MRTQKIAMLAVMASIWATAAVGATAPADHDEAMIGLARRSGCLTCHAIKAADASDSSAKPIGPAWADVAAKYKGQKDAARTLTNTVMGGSNPYASHWKGKVTGLAMPPNAVAISRPQARRLVHWILTLSN
jgi:cytochrome c